MAILESEQLYRSEKVIGPAKWLRDLKASTELSRNQKTKNNLVWRAIATAPAGFCHPRASMIGTLLEDLACGMDFAGASRRFKAKMHPLQYQRPQAAPSAGNIEQAEKIVEKLGIARSLERRFARFDEIQCIWKPKEEVAKKTDGVFGHLKSKNGDTVINIDMPPITVTWEKFYRTVVLNADTMEFQVPVNTSPYAAFVTAVNADAPPIIQWDDESDRNPVSWYTYGYGSPSHQWGLTIGQFVKVNGIAENPAHWKSTKFSHQGEQVLFILDGCRERNPENVSACLFPEILKSELREIRSTIEAYSGKARLSGSEDATACGIMLQKGKPMFNQTFRVTSGGIQQLYRIDRWD